ncbi:MAG: prepilin-type N-terminal cleavage/methylation domain-containing protein [Acidobacteriota bacterium]
MTPSSQRVDDGFTLLEVLLALFLLAGVALVLADLTCRAVRITDRARRQSVMAMMAEERVEQLLGLSWGLGEAAAAVPVTDTGTDLTGALPASGGPGLGTSPVDALSTDEPGHVDFADRRGTWVGSGPAVPAGAEFVRRWRIARVPSTSECLAIEVLVDVVDAAGRRAGSFTGAAVRVATVKARKAA